MKLIVRFGECIIMIMKNYLFPFGEFEIDILQYIYEMIVLSVPLKTSSSRCKDGSLKTEALDKLNELILKEETEEKK
jgi:uncharacterized metal-binding protein YceD (DUF177 family)